MAVGWESDGIQIAVSELISQQQLVRGKSEVSQAIRQQSSEALGRQLSVSLG